MPATAEYPEPDSQFAGSVSSGIRWKAMSQVVLQATRIGVLLVLARLLTPADYGRAGMVLVLSSFVLILTDLGLGAWLIQERQLTSVDVSTVFWTTCAAGAALTIGGVLVARPIAAAYHQPSIAPLVAVLSSSFVIGGVGVVQRSMLARAMNFRVLELSIVASTVIGGATAIAIAAAGGGAWAVIVQQVVGSAVFCMLNWTTIGIRPRFEFSRDSFQRMARFGTGMFGSRLFADMNQNADNMLVGRFLGAGPLGVYALAYNVSLAPVNRLIVPLTEVMFPALSRIHDQRDRMREAWLRTARVASSVTLPLVAGVGCTAPELVDVACGSKWVGAARVIQFLSIVGAVESLQRVNNVALLALGKSRLVLRLTLAYAVVNMTAIAVGLQWNVKIVATAYAISAAAMLPVSAVVTCHVFGASPWRYARSVGGVGVAVGALCASTSLLRAILSSKTMAHPAELLYLIVCGALVYIVVLRLASKSTYDEVTGLARQLALRRRDRGAPLAADGALPKPVSASGRS